MISVYFKTIRTKKFKAIEQFRAGSWINVENATPEDLEKICDRLGFEYEDLQDSLDLYEMSRFERLVNDLVIFLRYPSEETNGLYTQPMTVIVNQKHLLTISPRSNQIIKSMLERNIPLTTTQQSNLLVQVLLRISREFTVKIKEVSDRVMKQKKQLVNVDIRDIQFLIESEEILNQYLSALSPMEKMLQTLLSGNILKRYQEDIDLFEDLLISITQSANICSVTLKSIVALRDSYQIIFTNNLNRTIKFLTAFTVMLTLPTVIGSLFGMNVTLPLAENPFAFWDIIGLIGLLSVGILMTLNWKKLL